LAGDTVFVIGLTGWLTLKLEGCENSKVVLAMRRGGYVTHILYVPPLSMTWPRIRSPEDADEIPVARVAPFSPGKRKREVASQVEHWKPESNRGARWGRAIRPRNSVFGSAVLVFEVPVRAVGASSVSSPAGWRSTPDFEVLAPFPFSFVCFRHRRCDAVNQRILDIVNASSEAFLIPGCE
jgi:hypothetical protein